MNASKVSVFEAFLDVPIASPLLNHSLRAREVAR